MKLHLARKAPLKVGVIALVILTLAAGVALALTLGYADGVWSNADDYESQQDVYCLRYGANNSEATSQGASTADENQVRYGSPQNSETCDPFSEQSGFGFDGVDGVANFQPGDAFLLGLFTHYNWPIQVSESDFGDRLRTVDLAVALNFTDPAFDTTVNYTAQLDETPNSASSNPGGVCPYGNEGGLGCNDRVTFPGSVADETFIIGETEYTLQIIGFIDNGESTSCPTTPAAGSTPVSDFITGEQSVSRACLYARIVLPIDSGDAPDRDLGQTTGDVRAQHFISSAGSYLGTARPDGENDGKPTAAADGDDVTDSDDEDGFVSMDTAWGDGQGHVVVSVTRGQLTGINRACVYGWIDWGNDGFGVNTDSYATGHRTDSGNGVVTLTFSTGLPASGYFPPSTYLRLRVVSSTTSSCPALGPTGPAADGEIEDHLLSFSPLAVELAGFGATASPDGVTLAWETVSEIDVAGFNLYRG
ncbi:MAG: hypothetical protein GX621_12020, partial [Pirellulaceae bacterium]|nr:hypothetical protein [Pirellulaceae bacterium]